nr:radical SAM protein [Lachnospiraceae bacterium]
IEISTERLTEIFFELEEKGAHNINLVTGDHFIPQIADAISLAKDQDFDKPFIFNCSGYETVESLKRLEGLIDVYLPDFKYMEAEPARIYSGAEDYPEVAGKALDEMVRQCPVCEFDQNDSDRLIRKGVIVRHLLLPGQVMNSKKVLKYLYEKYKNTIYISIMSQYTPMTGIADRFPELSGRVKRKEYDKLVDYALGLGIENAFIQEMGVAKESFIPGFDNEGVTRS